MNIAASPLSLYLEMRENIVTFNYPASKTTTNGKDKMLMNFNLK